MSTQGCAQSEDYIRPEDVRYIVQADYNLASENRPQRDLTSAMTAIRDALERGATEIRLRPCK